MVVVTAPTVSVSVRVNVVSAVTVVGTADGVEVTVKGPSVS